MSVTRRSFVGGLVALPLIVRQMNQTGSPEGWDKVETSVPVEKTRDIELRRYMMSSEAQEVFIDCFYEALQAAKKKDPKFNFSKELNWCMYHALEGSKEHRSITECIRGYFPNEIGEEAAKLRDFLGIGHMSGESPRVHDITTAVFTGAVVLVHYEGEYCEWSHVTPVYEYLEEADVLGTGKELHALDVLEATEWTGLISGEVYTLPALLGTRYIEMYG